MRIVRCPHSFKQEWQPTKRVTLSPLTFYVKSNEREKQKRRIDEGGCLIRASQAMVNQAKLW